jgi:hypothetical protein
MEHIVTSGFDALYVAVCGELGDKVLCANHRLADLTSEALAMAENWPLPIRVWNDEYGERYDAAMAAERS